MNKALTQAALKRDEPKIDRSQSDWYKDAVIYQLHIKDDIRLLNHIRRSHPAMRDFTNLRFYNAVNDNVLYYGKASEDGSDFLLFHVNLDPHNPQGFQFEVPLWEFGLPDDASIEVEDLLNGNRFTWHGKWQGLELDPTTRPYAAWQLFAPGVPR